MGLSSIKWLNDHELFICMKTRKSSTWAVYDIRRKREAARGSTALDSSDESSERFLGDYIFRKGARLWPAMERAREAPVSVPVMSVASGGTVP